MQEHGVWPGCGQGASTWVGLAYEVNSVVILVSSCPTAVTVNFYLRIAQKCKAV